MCEMKEELDCGSISNKDSTREKVLASTMSVDEFFDELIEQVRHDYAII